MCFLPCHLTWHGMQISHCCLLLLWILHCLFTSWVLHRIILSAGVWYSHSGTTFYRQWENLLVKPSPIYACAYIKKTKSTFAVLFTMNHADIQQITYCYSSPCILSSGLSLALECFTNTQPVISITASTVFVNRQILSKLFSISRLLSVVLIVAIMVWWILLFKKSAYVF